MAAPETELYCPDPRLNDAIHYVLATPGKQMRAQLVREGFRLFVPTGTDSVTRSVTQAIEWLHTYSLVHDDLPAMDDDDMRRGQPTVHRAFDEATAILVGDGLHASAFTVIATAPELRADQKVALIALIGKAVGLEGMVGGQAMDMAGEGKQLGAGALAEVHRLKTGALISAALVAGAICADASEDDCLRLGRCAEQLGLAFQVTDDVLDVTASSEALGKTAGKDNDADKSTYVRSLGLEGAKNTANDLLTSALSELTIYGERADNLRTLAHNMVHRGT